MHGALASTVWVARTFRVGVPVPRRSRFLWKTCQRTALNLIIERHNYCRLFRSRDRVPRTITHTICGKPCGKTPEKHPETRSLLGFYRFALIRGIQVPFATCRYLIDLACGGADAPSNMQWQTIVAAKAKDKVERVG